MPTFAYWAKTADGKDVKGTKDAQNVGALVTDLKRQGLIVLNVEEASGGAKSSASSAPSAALAAAPEPVAGPKTTSAKRKPITTRDLAIFCRQLSTMLKAGLSIIDALETIANESDNLTMQETLFEMRDDIEGGMSLSESINKHPKVFSLMFRAMIEAGEASGSLVKIVAQLGSYMKKRDAMQKKIKSAMMYPKFVMGFFSLIVTGILLFLVPQFESTFKGMSKPCRTCSDPNAEAMPDPDFPNDEKKKIKAPGSGKSYTFFDEERNRNRSRGAMQENNVWVDIQTKTPLTAVEQASMKTCVACEGHGVTAKLPAMTQILLDASRFVKDRTFFVIGGIILLVILWRKYSTSETGRQQLDRLILKLPVAGPLTLKSSVARYCMTLSTLLHNGVSLDQSLDIVSRVAGNSVLEEATQGVRELIVQGNGLSQSMSRYPIFPPMVNKMISVGEESGALAEMLTDIAEFYEEEVNATVEGIGTIIEPLMIVMIGAVVCVVVLALYLPIFNMGKALTK